MMDDVVVWLMLYLGNIVPIDLWLQGKIAPVVGEMEVALMELGFSSFFSVCQVRYLN